jgi:hypothetical protein
MKRLLDVHASAERGVFFLTRIDRRFVFVDTIKDALIAC